MPGPTHPLDMSDYEPGVVAQAPGSIGDGSKNVAAAATREQLSATSVPCAGVMITARETNQGTVVVGGSTVVAALATRRGHPLRARESVFIGVNDLNKVYLDVTVSGEGVVFVFVGA